MKITFRKSFERDLRKIGNPSIFERIVLIIEEVEKADSLQEISNLKKLSNTTNFYRIRLGEYRIGIAVNDFEVEFVRCLHRRDIYRYFP